jgi:hypothetical protein
LALQFSREERVLFYSEETLYLFEKKSIYVTSVVAQVPLSRYLDVPCLLNVDFNRIPPPGLVMSGMFLLHATSPNPKNIEWAKQRPEALSFVLNPPGEEEITKASVFILPFFIREIPDYIQA